MENRKAPKANLEKARNLFLGIGFVLIAGVVYASFNYKTFDEVAYNFTIEIDEVEEEIVPLVEQEMMVTPPPPPPPKIEVPELEIVPDEVETPDEPIDDEPIEDAEITDLEPIEDAEEAIEPDVPQMWVKNMPYYPECKDATGKDRDKCTKNLIMAKIQEAYVVPEIAKEMGYEGTVYVRFVMNKQGMVSNVEVVRSVNEILDKAAVAAVKKLPRINPGKQLDKPVSVLYTVPVKVSFR